jgi:hypothetical protein
MAKNKEDKANSLEKKKRERKKKRKTGKPKLKYAAKKGSEWKREENPLKIEANRK